MVLSASPALINTLRLRCAEHLPDGLGRVAVTSAEAWGQVTLHPHTVDDC